MKYTIKLAALTSFAIAGSSQAAISVVDHHTFNDNAQPAGTIVVGGAPTYTGGSAIFSGAEGLENATALGVTDNFGLEIIVTWTGSFPGFSFPASITQGSNQGFGVVSIADGVSGHGNGGGGAFGTFTATIGTEYRLAVVRDNGVATFYVDGVAQAGTITNAHPVPSVLSMGFNRAGGGGTEGLFTGELNEVRTFTFNAGEFATSDLLTAATVPEPSSTALLGLGGLALILRRRK